MRNINGNKVTCSLFASFDFDKSECDQFLAAPTERRADVLNELLMAKNPNHDQSGYNAEQFYKAIGAALVEQRERELKQITNGPAPESEVGA